MGNFSELYDKICRVGVLDILKRKEKGEELNDYEMELLKTEFTQPSVWHQAQDIGVYEEEEPITIPLNFTANQPNSTIILNKQGDINPTYEYSFDNIEWAAYNVGDVITLENVGDKVYFRGNNMEVQFSGSAGIYQKTGHFSQKHNLEKQHYKT